jgi:hypothetical protein
MPAEFDISPVIPPTPHTSAPSPAPQVPAPVSPVPPMPRRSNSLLKWLMVGAAALFVISIASLWWGGNSFSDSGVIVTLEAPDRVTSGDEVTYTVTYRNDTKVPLSDMSFRLFYPEDAIVLKDGQPTTPDSEGFTVDRLEPGATGTQELKAFLVGDKGAIKTARLHLIFKAGTLRSSFEKEVSAATTITALPVTLTLVAPPTAVSGSTVQYILDVRNDSGADLDDLKVAFTYPDGFVVQSFSPQPDEGNTGWNLDRLSAGEGTRIRVEGVLPGNERETKTVSVVLQRNLNGQYVDYVKTEAFTMISSPLLAVSIAPEEGRDYVSFAGDVLRYVVSFRNNSRYTFLGLLLGVKLEGDMYDFTTLQTQNGYFDGASHTVIYDSSGVPLLAQLPPGASGQVSFSIHLKPGLSGGSGSSSFFVKASARLSTTNVPAGLNQDEVMAQDSLITKISTDPALTQAILYDDGKGTGPMPPKVGEETTFTVRWQIANPGNDVRNAKVTAILPPGVTWRDAALTSTGGSAPIFDANRNMVTWNIGTLPFGTGNGTARYEASFVIGIRPGPNQVGQVVPLINDTTLTGTDAFTSQQIEVVLRDADTGAVENHSADARVE